MLISVFTPVARTDYLLEAWRSLLLQYGVSWEWVLGLTAGVATTDIPSEIRDDPRTRLIRCTAVEQSKLPGIGRSKRECCLAAGGDVLVELDHDDLLVPGILAEIAAAMDRGAGFVYSDAAVFRQQPGLPSSEYSAEYGWTSYPFRIYGKEMLATRSFDISARSLADVMFAPDHVRAWARIAYARAGGHDPDLAVGDDHDLLCRTYLSHATMVHLNRVGYLYRWHGQNTTRKHNKAIQRQNVVNRSKYIRPLIDAWTRRLGLPSMEIRGQDYSDRQLAGLPSDSVGHIQVAELAQLPIDEAVELVRLAWDRLVPGGWLSIRCVSSASKWADLPTYRSRWNELSFMHLCSPRYWRESLHRSRMPPAFQPVRVVESRGRPGDSQIQQPEYLEVLADLCCVKDGVRLPGLLPD